ncbi:response regulator [Bacteroides sp. L10-4]|uniref:hybrid sensor histidine kinase/response regulator transcription factor n=2 Tax=Bacteroides TaxID=816 RepID=UPI00159577C5|nr:hybrid sensor histidine kinase/response regulator transcription factor [Bacteroides sp. L10-4]NVK92281.1 response regulator [Bacteroides sp. L10-4]
MKRLFLILCFLAGISGYPATASEILSVRRLNVENGLSYNTATCCLQDSYGFIWIGTENGLNRYDGCNNRIYRSSNHKHSLGNSHIKTLAELNQELWIGTENGIYIYRHDSDDFSHFDITTQFGVIISSEIRKIVRTHNGLMWIATIGQGLFIYNPQTNTMKQDCVWNSFINDICEDEDGCVYVLSRQKGLMIYDEDGNRKPTDTPLAEIAEGTGINFLQCIGGNLWFNQGSKLYCYQKLLGKTEVYEINGKRFGAIFCLIKYREKSLLVGTDKGIFALQLPQRTFEEISLPTGFLNIKQPHINDLMCDNEGNFWIMTNYNGVEIINNQLKRFEFYAIPATNVQPETGGKEIRAFYEDNQKNIWLGTAEGLWIFDPATGNLRKYLFENMPQHQPDICCLLPNKEELWIGTYKEGIYRLDMSTGKWKNYRHSQQTPHTIPSNDVLSLYQGHNGTIYVGTNIGLCRYRAETDYFLPIIQVGAMTAVTDILEDSHQHLWIATSNSGVFKMTNLNAESTVWSHYKKTYQDTNSIISNSITSLFEDKDAQMWFGTNESGICRFSEATGHFSVPLPGSQTSLTGNMACAVKQDRYGDLWISSNNGIFQIPSDNRKNIRQFTMNDGLQSNQFLPKASLLSSDNKLYFGGINGFNILSPEDIKNNPYIPPVYIMEIDFPHINDKEQADFGNALYMQKEIRLPYEYNTFSLRFAALSYEDPLKNQYSYRLKGVDKKWIANTSSHSASYTHLPPGEYEFQVRGANNDGLWNNRTASLRIVITPPWWLSIPAYITYALAFFFVIAYITYLWRLHIKRKYHQMMEDFRTTQDREIYKQKISFFINLVHEIRTPLSLICLPLEKLRDGKTEEHDKHLALIEKNVSYLLEITNQLLDFQKIENKKMKLNLKKHDVNAIIKDIAEQFKDAASIKGFELSVSLPAPGVEAMIDSDIIRKIIVNLMSNALKYAASMIELSLKESTDRIVICVNNDGPQIPDEQKEKIFQIFYQIPDSRKQMPGTGIGLAFSKSLAESHQGTLSVENLPSGGCSFILSLPLKKATEALPEAESHPENEGLEPDLPLAENKRHTVLIVEDNIELQNEIQEALGQWYKVYTANNGKEALEKLETNDVTDVIVSDVMMPEMDGIEMCRHIKSNLAYSHIPIILLTAKTNLESKTEGMENGAEVYMEKPFSISQLHNQIENLLKLRLAFHELMLRSAGTTHETPLSEYILSECDITFMKEVDTTLTKHLDEESFSVDNLADAMNMSRTNFYRKVKMLTGMAPNVYIKNFRLNQAAELLTQNMRINEVMLRVGFMAPSYFAKCFKAKFGKLPKEYQNTINK